MKLTQPVACVSRRDAAVRGARAGTACPRHLRMQARGPGPWPFCTPFQGHHRTALRRVHLPAPPPGSRPESAMGRDRPEQRACGSARSPSLGEVPAASRMGEKEKKETHLGQEGNDLKAKPVAAGPGRSPAANLVTPRSPEETQSVDRHRQFSCFLQMHLSPIYPSAE